MINPLVTCLLEKATHLQQDAFITFTMIHPTDKQRNVPSRHIASHNQRAIEETLKLVRVSNQMGWGAYIGIGYRNKQLHRYQRGGKEDILAIPALFADVERPPAEVKAVLNTVPKPSFMVSSGGGTHLYWMLVRPTKDIQRAEAIIKGMSLWLDADKSMSGDQILRLPMSINTKPERHNRRCHIIRMTPHEYHLDDFFGYELLNQERHQPPLKLSTKIASHISNRRGTDLNPTLSQALLQTLITHYGASTHPRKNDWYACHCPFHHRKDRFPGDHAYYNPELGLFNCFGRHGQLLNYELAQHLNIDVNEYGGIYH